MKGTRNIGASGDWRHNDFIRELRHQVRPGEQLRLEAATVSDIAPHFWREEAPTIAEWFINTAGAFDLDVSCLQDGGDYIVRHAVA